MYSKYEEMCVIKQVIKNYADNKKRQYESTISMLKDQTNSFPLDINSERANLEISSLQSQVSYYRIIVLIMQLVCLFLVN